MMDSGMTLETQVNTIIAGLTRKKINFIAIDFDLTMSSIHSGKSEWTGTEDDIAKSIRPFFIEFVPKALQHDMHLAVVTFSKLFVKIEAALKIVFGDNIASKIVVRGCNETGRWHYQGAGSRDAKQPHMASAVAALEEMNKGLTITRSSALLLDDQDENIKTALDNGVFAIKFDDTDVEGTIRNMLELFPNDGITPFV